MEGVVTYIKKSYLLIGMISTPKNNATYVDNRLVTKKIILGWYITTTRLNRQIL